MDKRICLLQEGQGWLALEVKSADVPGDETEGPRWVEWHLIGVKIAEAPSLIELLPLVGDHLGAGMVTAQDLPKPSKIIYHYRVHRQAFQKFMQSFYGGREKVMEGRAVQLESIRPFDIPDAPDYKNVVVAVHPMPEKAMPGVEEME